MTRQGYTEAELRDLATLYKYGHPTQDLAREVLRLRRALKRVRKRAFDVVDEYDEILGDIQRQCDRALTTKARHAK